MTKGDSRHDPASTTEMEIMNPWEEWGRRLIRVACYTICALGMYCAASFPEPEQRVFAFVVCWVLAYHATRFLLPTDGTADDSRPDGNPRA